MSARFFRAVYHPAPMNRLVPVLALASSLTACAHQVDYGRFGRLDDPEFILQTIEARNARVEGLVGEGKLGLKSPRGSGSLRMGVEVRKPESIYLETSDILGISRGTFATDGDRLYFYDPQENVFYTGPATAEELGRFLPIELAPDRLAQLMLGQLPILEDAEVRMEIDETVGLYVLYLRKGPSSQRVRVGTRDLRLVSIENRGPQPLSAEFSDHEELIEGLPFATTIDLSLPPQRTEVKLRYTRISLNPASEPGAFMIQPPPGARIEESR